MLVTLKPTITNPPINVIVLRLRNSTWLNAVALAPSITIVVAMPRKKAAVMRTTCARRV